MLRALLAALPAAKLPEGVTREAVDFGPGRGVRVFTPAGGGNGAALLFIHGGGMVIGNVVLALPLAPGTGQKSPGRGLTAAHRVALAQTDWRDLLMAAEFAHDVNAHKSWLPHRTLGKFDE